MSFVSSNSSPVIAKSFTANLAQVAATYDVATASGGNVLIKSIAIYVNVAGTGFTTVAFASSDTTPVILLAATVAAGVTIGLNFPALVIPFVLKSGKKIQFTLVGNGSAGSIIVVPEYYSLGGTLV